MADARREKRRRRILENSKSRLERFSSLQKDQRHVTEETEVEDNHSIDFQSDAVRHDDDEEMIDCCKDVENINEKSNFERTNETLSGTILSENSNIQMKADSFGICQTKHWEQRDSTSNNESCEEAILPDNKESNSDSSLNQAKSTNYNKRFRMIVFILLAWFVYLVVMRGFDAYLAYIIGRELPKEALGNLFLTGFVAVEIQLIMLHMFLIRESKPLSSLFVLAVKLSGVPQKLIHFCSSAYFYIVSTFTDFCVYLFTIIVLHTLDSKI